MVEATKTDVAKPDYLSLVNKGGSGFNVSELVTAIVASEIEPKRVLQTAKKEKTESSISGIGFLNSQVGVTQKNFQTIQSDKFFTTSSSSPSHIEVMSKDESKLSPGLRSISDVKIAKKMIFELGGFTNLTDTFSANLTIDYGSWVKTDGAANSTTSFESEKTYIVTSEITGDDVTAIRNNSSWTNPAATIPVGSTFTINQGSNGSISQANIRHVDKYTFSDANGASSDTLNFTNKTISEIVALFDAEKDLEAKLVDITGEGTNYSIIISGDDTGFTNGFRITGNQRWETSTIPDANANSNKFSQLSSDSSFKLDGVEVTRKKNSITDLIDGASIELKADYASAATVGISRSSTSIQKTVEDIIFSLNEFKSEIDRLTFIDIEGEENGPLAMDPSAASIKSKFKRLAIQPLAGFGNKSVYLSQLGIKTTSNGEYVFDEANFDKTFLNNPEYFGALKDDNLSTNSSGITVSKSDFTTLPEGKHTVSQIGGQWKIGNDDLQRVDFNGGSRFTSIKYPGLVIVSATVAPPTFEVYAGENFSKKIEKLMTSVLDFESPLNNAVQSYQNISSDIDDRLKKLEEREELITSRYTSQFGKMEQSMTQFNSTKTLLDNFIEAWKKQK